jgi:hypothetical protein
MAKGKMISVYTTNGGFITGLLLETYRPTFSVVISRNGGYIVIPAWRIKSVEAA